MLVKPATAAPMLARIVRCHRRRKPTAWIPCQLRVENMLHYAACAFFVHNHPCFGQHAGQHATLQVEAI